LPGQDLHQLELRSLARRTCTNTKQAGFILVQEKQGRTCDTGICSSYPKPEHGRQTYGIAGTFSILFLG